MIRNVFSLTKEKCSQLCIKIYIHVNYFYYKYSINYVRKYLLYLNKYVVKNTNYQVKIKLQLLLSVSFVVDAGKVSH